MLNKAFRNELSGDSSEHDETETYRVILENRDGPLLEITTSKASGLYRCTVYFYGRTSWEMQVRAESPYHAEHEASRRAEKLSYAIKGLHVEAM